jgi:hypothetical protein
MHVAAESGEKVCLVIASGGPTLFLQRFLIRIGAVSEHARAHVAAHNERSAALLPTRKIRPASIVANDAFLTCVHQDTVSSIGSWRQKSGAGQESALPAR